MNLSSVDLRVPSVDLRGLNVDFVFRGIARLSFSIATLKKAPIQIPSGISVKEVRISKNKHVTRSDSSNIYDKNENKIGSE
uniref:Uncharacterized protein n=1 Tax=Caenorhabditis japonica TaxID=281687 RepID=A0A8R1EBT0_CAEJA